MVWTYQKNLQKQMDDIVYSISYYHGDESSISSRLLRIPEETPKTE